MRFGRNIDLVPDVVAPAAVTAVNIAARSFTGTLGSVPYADVATYAMFGGGYISAYMGWGGEFMKNVGIAAAPLAFEKIYNMIKGGTTRMATTSPAVARMNRVAGSIRQTTKPEFEGQRSY